MFRYMLFSPFSKHTRTAYNSAKHIELQKKLGEEAATLRNINAELEKLNARKNVIHHAKTRLDALYRCSKTEENHKGITNELNHLNFTENNITHETSLEKNKREQVLSRMYELLVDLKKEVASKDEEKQGPGVALT